MDRAMRIISFDFLSTKSIYILLIPVFYTVNFLCSFLSGIVILLPFMFLVEATFLVGLIFITSERYGLDKLLGTFTIKRKDIIRGRYYSSLCNGIMMQILSITAMFILIELFNFYYSQFKILLFSSCVGFFLFCLIISVQMPLYFSLSAAKAKIVLLIPLILFIFILPMYNNLNILSFSSEVFLYLWDNTAVLLLSTLGISGLMIAVSYFLSCKAYMNKDL